MDQVLIPYFLEAHTTHRFIQEQHVWVLVSQPGQDNAGLETIRKVFDGESLLRTSDSESANLGPHGRVRDVLVLIHLH